MGFEMICAHDRSFDGTYRKVGLDAKGWPVLKNGSGRFCYRYSNGDWHLATEHSYAGRRCTVEGETVNGLDGALPAGDSLDWAQYGGEAVSSPGWSTWKVWQDSEWQDRNMRVTVCETFG
jgi:hypothetical protein